MIRKDYLYSNSFKGALVSHFEIPHFRLMSIWSFSASFLRSSIRVNVSCCLHSYQILHFVLSSSAWVTSSYFFSCIVILHKSLYSLLVQFLWETSARDLQEMMRGREVYLCCRSLPKRCWNNLMTDDCFKEITRASSFLKFSWGNICLLVLSHPFTQDAQPSFLHS